MRTERRRSRRRKRRGGGWTLAAVVCLAAAVICGVALMKEGRFDALREKIQPETREITTNDETIAGRETEAGRESGSAARETEGETAPEKPPLPSSFDFRDTGYQPDVPDQGDLGTCWAFASLRALESSMIPEDRLPLSADHMSLKNSFAMTQDEGGDYMMAIAYLLAWQGPVAEADDPYGDKKSPDDLSPVCHVQEVRIQEGKDIEWMKRAVLEHGGLQSSLYVPVNMEEMRNVYYQEDTHAFFYDGDAESNHDVVVIGWDDNFPKENFKIQPEQDGAFLCMNSWGKEFGEDGCFFVSYEDTGIGGYCLSYSGIGPVDNYDRIYQTDLCGWIGRMGFGSSRAWFANVYQAQGDETLRAAGFYATRGQVSYKVYVAKNIPQASDQAGLGRTLSRGRLAASGTLADMGYYTIPFEEGIRVGAGERFAVIVEIDGPGEEQPVAVEYQSDSRKANVDIRDGEGYISFDGTKWQSAEKTKKCNICLKVYTSAG